MVSAPDHHSFVHKWTLSIHQEVPGAPWAYLVAGSSSRGAQRWAGNTHRGNRVLGSRNNVRFGEVGEDWICSVGGWGWNCGKMGSRLDG